MTSIVPKERITSATINCFDYLLAEFVPNTKASFRVVLKTDLMPVAVEYVTLEGDDYKLWGSDDNFITRYICDKLGLVLASS
jgi:hypothetical protein